MAAVRIERTEKAANKEAVPVGGGRRNCRFVITCICLLSGTTTFFRSVLLGSVPFFCIFQFRKRRRYYISCTFFCFEVYLVPLLPSFAFEHHLRVVFIIFLGQK